MNKQKNKKIVKAEKPGGFLDYLTPEFLAREKMLETVNRVFRSFGFDPIETPRVEFLKTLAGETSDTGKSLFRIISQEDDEPLAMPFDHTVPFARLLAANPYDAVNKIGVRLPWRRMVVGPVFRGEKPQNGRYRQFYQFDADIAGTDAMIADAEILNVIYQTFTALGVERFLIRLNNRKILNGLGEAVGISNRGKVKAEDITKEMMRRLDKLDKIGIKRVLEELTEKPNDEYDPAPALDDKGINIIKAFLGISGSNSDRLAEARKIFKGVKIAEKGIDELEEILNFLPSMSVPEEFVAIDFSIARGLDYYIGPVMETILLDAPEFGSVFGGGRYDDLVKRFTGESLPAVGASMGVDRFFAALKSLGLVDTDRKTVTDIMIIRVAPGRDKEYLSIADKLREAGFNTEICLLGDTTFQNQFNFALSRGAKFVVIAGEDEFKRGVISVKNFQTRKQVDLKKEDLVSWIKSQ
jgi:histidyl-tRNA synthetase